MKKPYVLGSACHPCVLHLGYQSNGYVWGVGGSCWKIGDGTFVAAVARTNYHHLVWQKIMLVETIDDAAWVY